MSVGIKQIGDMKIKVVSEDDSISYKDIISDQDAEMDRRAIAAVRSAIEKAKVCNKPIAKFDVETKRAYLEYPDDNTIEPFRIIRKHKEDISIFSNDVWSEKDILELM